MFEPGGQGGGGQGDFAADRFGAHWQRWQMQDVSAGWKDEPVDNGGQEGEQKGEQKKTAASACNTLRLVNGVVKKGAVLKTLSQSIRTGSHGTGYADGHAQGMEKGREQSYQAGQQSGYEDGYEDGYKAGQQAGGQAGHEAGYKAGYEAGYEAGHASGQASGQTAGEQALREQMQRQVQQQVQEQTQQQAARLDALMGSAQTALAQLGAQLHEQLAQSLMELALGIAQQVVQTTLKVDPSVLLATVQQVLNLQGVADQGGSEPGANLRLYVHPDDEQIVGPFVQALPGRSGWQIITDKSIAPGGCVLHTALGQVDATLQTRWQRLSDRLKYDFDQYVTQHASQQHVNPPHGLSFAQPTGADGQGTDGQVAEGQEAGGQTGHGA